MAITTGYCNDFVADPQSYQRRQSKFAFDKKIYGHHTVKKALEKCQHGKCCYCEGLFNANSPGDVEHFRPKQCYQQGPNTPVEYPGYYWLAYTWSNLYFSCPNCNRSWKKNLFPLANPLLRARSHTRKVGAERPLLLDPGGPEDPRQHIHFHEELAVGKTKCGRMTIEIIRLNRSDLCEARLARMKVLKCLKQIVDNYDTAPPAHPSLEWVASIAEAKDILAAAINADAIFSAMSEDLL